MDESLGVEEMGKVGFIGLGIMGRHMAKNLLEAGYALAVYDIVESAVKALGEQGAKMCGSIQEVAEQCDLIITMLPNSPQVKTVVLGPDGIINFASPGTLVLDMSSIAPAASIEIHEQLQAKQMHLLDAPVSGGETESYGRDSRDHGRRL